VTGATGNIGSVVLETLAAHEVDVVAGSSSNCDFRDDEQVAKALHGVDSVFLLIPFTEHMVEWGERIVRAAAGAGVRFILRLSGLAATPDSDSAMGRLHGQIDVAVRESGVPYCVLRANAFMQNFSGLYSGMMRNGVVRLPEASARLNFVDTRDIGEAAARILLLPLQHTGKTYDLDGPDALSNADACRIIKDAVGIPLEYRAIPPERANTNYREFGMPEWKIDVLDSLAGFIRDGGAERRSGTLQQLLQRQARTFEQFARDYRSCWIPE